MILTERDQARFWAKVALPDGNGCMLWTASQDFDGYGRFRLAGKNTRAHQVAYTLAYGPILEGLEIDHVKARGCTNRHCVAPLHLEAVTHAENTRRGKTITAANTAKTHCPQGHPYDDANTRASSGGGRRCLTCQRRRDHVRRGAVDVSGERNRTARELRYGAWGGGDD